MTLVFKGQNIPKATIEEAVGLLPKKDKTKSAWAMLFDFTSIKTLATQTSNHITLLTMKISSKVSKFEQFLTWNKSKYYKIFNF